MQRWTSYIYTIQYGNPQVYGYWLSTGDMTNMTKKLDFLFLFVLI